MDSFINRHFWLSYARIIASSKADDIVRHTRACLKNTFRKMYVTICGRFCPDEGVVAGYGNRIRAKYTAKWGVQIAGMIFQTRSRIIAESEDAGKVKILLMK